MAAISPLHAAGTLDAGPKSKRGLLDTRSKGGSFSCVASVSVSNLIGQGRRSPHRPAHEEKPRPGAWRSCDPGYPGRRRAPPSPPASATAAAAGAYSRARSRSGCSCHCCRSRCWWSRSLGYATAEDASAPAGPRVDLNSFGYAPGDADHHRRLGEAVGRGSPGRDRVRCDRPAGVIRLGGPRTARDPRAGVGAASGALPANTGSRTGVHRKGGGVLRALGARRLVAQVAWAGGDPAHDRAARRLLRAVDRGLDDAPAPTRTLLAGVRPGIHPGGARNGGHSPRDRPLHLAQGRTSLGLLRGAWDLTRAAAVALPPWAPDRGLGVPERNCLGGSQRRSEEPLRREQRCDGQYGSGAAPEVRCRDQGRPVCMLAR